MANHTMDIGEEPYRPQMIGFVLVPDFSMVAFTTAVEPLRVANRIAGKELYGWPVVSKDGGPVRASSGIVVGADMSIADVQRASAYGRPIDMVIVCAGINVERYRDDEVFGWLRRMERMGADIGAVCTGAWVLAKVGLLNGYKCAIHWENLPGFVETFPEIDVNADLYEVDRNRYTCCGGTAAMDMILDLIREQHGQQLATKVSEQFMVDRIRSGGDRQRLPIGPRLGVHNPKLIGAVELMEANLSEPLSQDELAQFVGLSRRQLERLFRKHLGRAPAQYYLELRLERARHLLYQSELPIVDLSLACGFVSASHFSKCYREMYGKSPREERAISA